MSFEDKLAVIDQMKQQMDAHGPLYAELQKRINYKFRLEWNYNSNIMEGNSLTRQETRSVMVGNITVGGKPLKDVLEMKGHDEVVKEIIKMGQGDLNLSEARIKKMHTEIMHEDDPGKKKFIGIWKTQNNYLFNYKNERVDFVPCSEVKERMHQLVDWLNAEKDKIQRKDKGAMHPIALAFRFHLDYISIHPFYDGNGRTARIFTNLILVAYGYPPLYIKLEEKDRYYQYLADVQEYGGAKDLFYDFMGDMLMRSMHIVLDAIAGKGVEEPDDIDKEIAMWKKELSVMTDEPVPKSLEIIVDLYNNSISPFIDRLLIKFHKNFHDLFTKWNVYGDIDNQVLNDQYQSKASVDNFMKSSPHERIRGLSVTMFMIGFKKNGANAFDIAETIHLKFENFVYKISFNGSVVAEKLYNQSLSDEDEAKIIQDAVAMTFNKIKGLIKNK